MEDKIVESAMDLFRPVIEQSIVLAAHYATKSGRDTVLHLDSVYAMRFCARNMVGKHLGSLYPEIYEETDSQEDDEEDYVVDDTDVEFSRYSGDDELLTKVNECYDTWDTWIPGNDAERMIKNAIDKVDAQ